MTENTMRTLDYHNEQRPMTGIPCAKWLTRFSTPGYIVSGIVVAIAVWQGLPMLGALAAVTALVSLYAIQDQVYATTFSYDDKPRQYAALGWSIFVYLLGSGLIALIATQGSAIAALVGTWVSLVGLSGVVATTRVLNQGQENSDTSHTWRWMLGSLLLGLMSFVLTYRLSSNDKAIAWWFLVGLLGIVVSAVSLRLMCRKDAKLWSIVGSVVIGTALVNLFVAINEGERQLLWIVVSAVILVLGFIPLSMALPLLAHTWKWAGTIALVAVGTSLGAVFALAWADEVPLAYLLIFFLASLAIGLAFVLEGFEMIPLLVVGLALTAVVADRTDSNELPTAAAQEVNHLIAKPQKILVAIGDSYISGEGADRYFPGTNVKNLNECRRSSSAYPFLVARELGWALEFYACSGAVTTDILDWGQQITAPDDVPQIERLENLLDRIDGDPDREIGAVIISIGGNDAWFGAVAQACLAPGSCAEHRTTVLQNVEEIGKRVYAVHASVRALTDAPIVAMAYPLAFSDVSCSDAPITEDELKFIIEFTEVLNDRLATSAKRAGVNWFGPSMEAFAGARICDTDSVADSVVNLTNVNPQQGALLDRLNPLNWLHGNAHPKAEGHARIAELLKRRLQELDGNPEPDLGAQFRIAMETPSRRVSTRLLTFASEPSCARGELPVSALVQTIGPNENTWRLPAVLLESDVCYTRADGTWSEGEITTSDPWSVTVPVVQPIQGYTQTIVYQSVYGTWEIRVLEFCEPNPGCADDIQAMSAWTTAQISEKMVSAATPISLIFVGSWLMAVETKRRMYLRPSAPSAGEPVSDNAA